MCSVRTDPGEILGQSYSQLFYKTLKKLSQASSEELFDGIKRTRLTREYLVVSICTDSALNIQPSKEGTGPFILACDS